jgi:thioredoxin-like negative regulator of GroEL
LNYIRAQYNRSAQIDPPFFQELARSEKERQENYSTNILARTVAPLDRLFIGTGDRVEKRRRSYTSWFTDKDFVKLPEFAARLRPGPQQDPVSKFLYENFRADTRNLLASGSADNALRAALARDLNYLIDRELETKNLITAKKNVQAALEQELLGGTISEKKRQQIEVLKKDIADLSNIPSLYQPERFQQVQISEYLQDFIKQNPQSHTRVRLNRLLLEAAYPAELAKSKGGVYPDREIYIATPDDSSRCFNEYMADANRRRELGQLKPGEDVRYDPASGKVQIGGQVAVMNINGLITKVIFDHNPKNEFYVEESFPLDWMYPHLTPYGVIMKINREPLAELSEEAVKKDHEFWSKYSERLIGNWITYDTKVKDIADWVEKTYLRRNFTGFTGDRKFIRDDQAQKSFSKLRSSIGGVYNWRIANAKPGSPEHQRMVREADFAFRQAFAFCPYSPEAVFRYVNLLLTMQRFDDALIVASTCQKLDPYNRGVVDLVDKLREWSKQRAALNPAQLEKALETNPQNFQAAFNLAGAYLQNAQTDRAIGVLDAVLNSPSAEANALRALLQAYGSITNAERIQRVADKLAAQFQANPSNLEAGIGLAEADRMLQKPEPAMQTLDKVFASSNLEPNALLQVAQHYAAMGNYARLESALEKLVKMAPTSPEAWYDLASLKATVGNTQAALVALRQALDLNAQRHRQDPKARDLSAEVEKDQRFSSLRQLPEYKRLLSGK